MKRFEEWLINWLDGLHYSSRSGTWLAYAAGELCMWRIRRFAKKYGEAPMVTNG